MSSHSLQFQPATSPERRPLREEVKHLAPVSDRLGAVKTIAPGSAEWQRLGVDRRLEIAPFLETLIRTGRARLVYTEERTSTCEEKAQAAGISVESTVKALFCKDIYSGSIYALVVSGKGRVNLGSALSGVETLDFTPGLELCAAQELPHGMEFGTCSAFISPKALEGVAMVAIEDPATPVRGKKGKPTGQTLGDLEADLSIGGTDETAHHLSVRMKYSDFAGALMEQYGDKAVLAPGIKRD
jgi:prolyl-tRNA editing enzyme YbaK/EbsC (Cys-tRNA(Pro) deacylase)